MKRFSLFVCSQVGEWLKIGGQRVWVSFQQIQKQDVIGYYFGLYIYGLGCFNILGWDGF